ncbi:hypothetical protein MKW94_002247 [Papaver nudicaule]|uniref:Annexin n=1 Tax=Papaver nudicaule TaxID=74823 RepID=A0AA41W1I3_PAPNU|nr:hypothetical protein [Papaver nudicaule]
MASLIVPDSIPSVAEDCEQLHKAFSGWGTNEDLIIDILAHRNAAQRKHIRQVYAETYGQDLLHSLEQELSSDFERIVLLWTLDPAERDAVLLNESTKRWTSNSQVILEIACTRSSHTLLLAKQAYHARFKKSLEEDVAAHITGDFRKLLVPLVSTYRYEGPEVNTTLAKHEAKILHQHISEKEYNHEEILRILTTRSKTQLFATFNHYNNEFGTAITKDLKAAAAEDDFVTALKCAIKCLVTPEKYFEKVLRSAINKTGTDEWALTRVVATRVEVDMNVIKEEYYRRNTVQLDHAIKRDTSGDYERMLVALIGA